MDFLAEDACAYSSMRAHVFEHADAWLSIRMHPELKFGKILFLSIYLFFYMLFDFVWLYLGPLIVFNCLL